VSQPTYLLLLFSDLFNKILTNIKLYHIFGPWGAVSKIEC